MRNALTWFETGFHWLAIIWALAVLAGAVALAVIGISWWREDRTASEWDEDDEEQVQDRERRMPELPQRHRLGALAASLDSHDQPQAGMHLDGYAADLGHQPARNWRSETAEQLSPAHLDAENLPGPVEAPRSWEARAGELHPYETAFPAILQLGQPGDGTANTFARMDMYRMTVRNAVEAARRELAAECGIRYVPMELVAA